jgi:cobalt/nickel transport system permease protein
MHMADALLSPVVGGVMWAASAGAIAYSSAQLGKQVDDRKAPLMGVLGAFIFAAQMINVAIPGTGASGHISGSLLLSILLGPHAAFLTIASVLVVQALFFADGGLLALGCNIFNLGFIPAFIVFPMCYRRFVGSRPDCRRAAAVTFLSAVLAMQLGSLAVVIETVVSGISSLPFATFALVMQPIHLVIGILEGAATVAVVSFVRRARPEMVADVATAGSGARSLRMVGSGFLAGAMLTAAVLSWYASEKPDGLEWAVARVAGEGGVPAATEGILGIASSVQRGSALFPDYDLRKSERDAVLPARSGDGMGEKRVGTSIAGIVGSLLTLLIALCLGLLFKRRKQIVG